MTKAILFDLDGTLADTVPLIAEQISAAITAHARPVSAAAVVPYIGVPLIVTLTDLSGLPAEDERIAAITDQYFSAWDVAVVEHGPALLLPGVADLLADLRSAGIPTGVVTAKDTGPAIELLEAMGIADVVDVVVGTDLVVNGKPEPDSALLALERLGATAADSWYVGDAASDIAMAIASGLRPVGITTGAALHEELVAAGADIVIAHASEVLTLLTDDQLSATAPR